MLPNTFSIYLKSTFEFGIYYREGESTKLKRVHWCRLGRRHRKSQIDLRIHFPIGSEPVTWSLRKQPTVALSSIEAKYRSLTEGAKEAAWLKLLLCSIGQSKDKSVKIHCDNHSCIKIARSDVYHVRTKHIEVHYHYIREWLLQGEIELCHVASKGQLADVLTKPLGKIKFCTFRKAIGIYSLEDAEVLVGVGDLSIK